MSTPRDSAAQAAPIETANDLATPRERPNTGSCQNAQNGAACPARDITVTEYDVDTSGDHVDEPPQTRARGDAGSSGAAASEARQQDSSAGTENNELGRGGHVHTQIAASHGHLPTGNLSLPIRTVQSGQEVSQNVSLQAENRPPERRRHDSASRTRIIGSDGQIVDLESIIFPQQNNPPQHSGRRSSLRRRTNPPQEYHGRSTGESPVFTLPGWQPDSDVTLCPICNTQFSIWIRKHHCRKCGRVVCNSCSPHRIIIPNQFIVRPPGSDASSSTGLFADRLGTGYVDADGVPGGDRVRLCNPCVPDPNTAPPQSPAPQSPRSTYHRSRTLSSTYGGISTPGRYGGLSGALQAVSDFHQHSSSRSRNIATNDSTRGHNPVPTTSRSASHQTPLERYMSLRSGYSSSSQFSTRSGLLEDLTTSPRHRALPPTPQIAEEDECPICHRELPARTLPDSEALREQHITACIQSHSTYGSPAAGNRTASASAAAAAAPRRTGMYTYAATEKDCVDDAECTICLEEFVVGVPMARLECLCRFHRACIAAWFVNHPGRCPVHQHDGFGF